MFAKPHYKFIMRFFRFKSQNFSSRLWLIGKCWLSDTAGFYHEVTWLPIDFKTKKFNLIFNYSIVTCNFGAINSEGECHLHTVEVTGSNPVSPTKMLATPRSRPPASQFLQLIHMMSRLWADREWKRRLFSFPFWPKLWWFARHRWIIEPFWDALAFFVGSSMSSLCF